MKYFAATLLFAAVAAQQTTPTQEDVIAVIPVVAHEPMQATNGNGKPSGPPSGGKPPMGNQTRPEGNFTKPEGMTGPSFESFNVTFVNGEIQLTEENF
mmetsp:Transcript_31600/g.48320  ORF Transcript_31600/g.48320 Transcript_31600/m.48320 type:complete len:98 (+) Transcript_31600:1-294(+)